MKLPNSALNTAKLLFWLQRIIHCGGTLFFCSQFALGNCLHRLKKLPPTSSQKVHFKTWFHGSCVFDDFEPIIRRLLAWLCWDWVTKKPRRLLLFGFETPLSFYGLIVDFSIDVCYHQKCDLPTSKISTNYTKLFCEYVYIYNCLYYVVCCVYEVDACWYSILMKGDKDIVKCSMLQSEIPEMCRDKWHGMGCMGRDRDTGTERKRARKASDITVMSRYKWITVDRRMHRKWVNVCRG